MKPDSAVLAARRVVGLYGDPDVTWSIVLALDLRTPIDPDELRGAAETLVDYFPHLGDQPVLRRFDTEAENGILADFANTPYADREPLVRVALSEDTHSILLAAHHGAVDGLGLLGVAAALVGDPLSSSVRGIERNAEPHNFFRVGIRRILEAFFRPPLRVRADRRTSATGDLLEAFDVAVERPGSAALLVATVEAVRNWNAEGARRGRLLVAMGLSRRPGSPTPSPDRDTAYVRLAAGAIASIEDAARLIKNTVPEPAFPVSDGGGLGPRIARLLSARLGSTVLVSNLGLIDHPRLARVRFWPVPTGPAGVAIGLAGVKGSSTLTVRARSSWFSPEATTALTAELGGRFAEVAGTAPAQYGS